ncbi:serine hydrolase domain-containing protein [Oceanobacillus jeddahense]|uniref:Beta-lactamase family protein n=1 Tax=Oceanobacillus jeddahense TaxID=1462527 RepID=A0ABY5JT77_9BACI|nr:serine hydrolase domain-containing protein [Oceanobacillus jeddahense]UUI02378.1 beta-lactamase family protein [Oceanobacillus jeddahense]
MKQQVLQLLEKEISLNHLPGAVVQVMHKDEIILREAVGSRYNYNEKKAPMMLDTVFDLASLTKVVATLPAVLKLIDEGEIRLDDPVTFFLPSFAANGKEEVKLRHLLTHTSGLPAHREYYKEELTKGSIINEIEQEELIGPIGANVVYSDLGFILLYHIIEKVTDQLFNQFLSEQFYKPLGMTETGFCPTFNRERYATTEYSEKLNDYKFGIVHDDNAESMSGMSGHAGLFSTIEDLTRFTQMIENEGIYNGKRLLTSAALKLARSNFTESNEDHRGLGWMRKSPTFASCGDYFSNESYGHTGFTGTSIWFDPSVHLNIILLTNRVHFGRDPHIIRLRPRLHNIIRSYF